MRKVISAAQREKNKKLGIYLKEKNFSAAKEILEKGANIEAPYANVAATIAQNIITSDHESNKILLDLGANVNAKDGYGRTALFIICSKCDEPTLEITKYLRLGGDINSRTRSGRTALFEAVGLSLNKTKALIKHGIDINAQDENGATALIESIKSAPDKSIVEFLLLNHADPNIGDNNGETALHHLAKLNTQSANHSAHLKALATLLIQQEVDIHIKNNNGKTAIQLVNNLPAAKILVNNGANINVQYSDNSGASHNLIGDLLEEISYKNPPEEKHEILFFLLENGANLLQKHRNETILEILAGYAKPYARSPVDKNKLKRIMSNYEASR